MKFWFEKDWYGKDKPSKEKLIKKWKTYFSLFMILVSFFVVFSFLNFLSLQIMFGVLTLLYADLQQSVKQTYYELYRK